MSDDPRQARTVYVCTVHFRTEKWIKPQCDFLDRYLGDCKVFACVPPERKRRDFYLETVHEPGMRDLPLSVRGSQNHADKLNELARLVSAVARPEDILVFLDGDAFPIAPLRGLIEETLQAYPFMAVRRQENNGDLQPHPCFAATTVGFWNAIGGDWSVGTWINGRGDEVTDTGGRLLHLLSEQGVRWHAMTRSNRHNLHPLWFGIYDGVIYHHGAGYRKPVARIDWMGKGMSESEYRHSRAYKKLERLQRRIEWAIRFRPDFHRRLTE